MTNTMLAGELLVSEKRLEMKQLPIPDPGHGEALIKVAAAGVCMSDVHLIDGTISPFYLDTDVVTLGHEVAGTIEALGEGVVSGLSVGQRVVLRPTELQLDGRLFTRGVDFNGGWAEYTIARSDALVAIPDSLPFEQAAILPDAVSTPWSAITASVQTRPADAVGVWGLGGLGVHAVELLRLIGAAPILALDPNEAARARASHFGADASLDTSSPELADQVKEFTKGRGLNLAFDFAGAPPVREQALSLLNKGGRLVIVGMSGKSVTIPKDETFSFNRHSIIGAYGSEPQHIDELVRLTEHQRLDLSGSVSQTLPLSEAPKAVENLKNKVGNPIRIVLQPGS